MQTAAENIDHHQAGLGGVYNGSITSKLARHLFRLPSRMLSRMRHLDGIFDQHLGQANAESGTGGSSGVDGIQQRIRDSGVTPLPGPWGFLTSGYFFGLFFMVSP